ncbi:MAG: hypothetical protein ACJASX_000355 [Limisphaerales bacterium]|jgi:hypothetical protein
MDSIIQSGFDYHRGVKGNGTIPLPVERKRAGDLLAFSFVHHLRSGDGEAAKECLQSLLRWGALQIGDRLIISEILRYGTLEKTIRVLGHGLSDLPWTDDELAQLQTQVEGWDLIRGLSPTKLPLQFRQLRRVNKQFDCSFLS